MSEINYASYDALVIGTGAAGYNAAIRIAQENKKSVAIITEGVNCGTSRNTGSDKQTYYKLGLGGDSPDSVRRMAQDMFSCGAVDGDNALCEAALSVRSFMNLCELGVEFPVNRFGEYVGYKTDHDPFARATSAGPLTSAFMTQALEKKAADLKIPVLDSLLALEILKDEDGVCGLVCLEKESGEPVCIRSSNIVLATGGPAGIYADSVYPKCHTGSTSLAINAGAALQNMTEWQYGLASVSPRWNVSGTYMQVLPCFVSVDEKGNRHEFLLDFFTDKYEAMSQVFLKGYQWPFDSRKVMDGSSVIDLLVYRECVIKKRHVFLDYTKNPFGLEKIEFNRLSGEAGEYLIKAQACFGTPIERLLKMNAPAVQLYSGKGVDLKKEPLEIALCAQHNNGGISVDMWWQTKVPGLFAAGECAGTHGITRPGGSALNAGQVGSLRAAQYISQNGRPLADEKKFKEIAFACFEKHVAFCEKILQNKNNVELVINAAQRSMSDSGGAIRETSAMKAALSMAKKQSEELEKTVGVGGKDRLYLAYKLKDILICQQAVLAAMIDFTHTVGETRGSALLCDKSGRLRNGLEEVFRFSCAMKAAENKIQQVEISGRGFELSWRDVRSLPSDDDFFENIWRGYRLNKNIY